MEPTYQREKFSILLRKHIQCNSFILLLEAVSVFRTLEVVIIFLFSHDDTIFVKGISMLSWGEFAIYHDDLRIVLATTRLVRVFLCIILHLPVYLLDGSHFILLSSLARRVLFSCSIQIVAISGCLLSCPWGFRLRRVLMMVSFYRCTYSRAIGLVNDRTT